MGNTESQKVKAKQVAEISTSNDINLMSLHTPSVGFSATMIIIPICVGLILFCVYKKSCRKKQHFQRHQPYQMSLRSIFPQLQQHSYPQSSQLPFYFQNQTPSPPRFSTCPYPQQQSRFTEVPLQTLQPFRPPPPPPASPTNDRSDRDPISGERHSRQ